MSSDVAAAPLAPGRAGGSALMPLLRIEWRSLRRSPGRSLLILTLVAVPVATMITGGTLLRLSQVAAAEAKPDPFLTFVVFLVGGLAFLEAALVIAAAFAVGMRRRQREIGLVGATGASPGHIRTALVGSATMLAVLGVTLGLGAGMALTAALYPFLEGWSGRPSQPLAFATVDLIGASLFGVLTAAAAAARPAHSASQLPVTVSLSGRRPATRPATSSGRWGLGLFALGCGLMGVGAILETRGRGYFLMGGCAVALLALCVTGGWILDRLARLAGPLPLVWRLAVRDAGRFRGRNAPVVAAITAAMSMSVLLLALIAGVEGLVASRNADGDIGDIDGGTLLYVAVAISSSTSLLVVLVVTALSLVESAADGRALESIGARPKLLRHLSAARACYLALLGCALAIPGGLLPALVLMAGEQSPLIFDVPWLRLVAALSVLPVAAYAAMWLLSPLLHGANSLRPRVA